MKKIMIMAFGAGIVGFGAMFGVAWVTKPKPVPSPPPQQTDASPPLPVDPAQSQVAVAAEKLSGTEPKLTMTDQQLQTLIFEVREKIKEYNLKLESLDLREKRLQTAQETLKQDIESMKDLRVELASSVAALKSQQEQLEQSRIRIDKVEENNLLSLAATYDKMPPESAGKILMNMVKNKGPGNSTDDAVRILHYMTERTKAKVLASMADAEPAVSAYLCQKLKRMMIKE